MSLRLPLLSLASLAALVAACESYPDVAIDPDGGEGGVPGFGGTGTGGIIIEIEGGSPGVGGGSGVEAICGNGEREPGELCDDGNTDDDDGCSADCSEIGDGYFCLEPGEDCVKYVVCGSGLLEGNEECDDGNTDGDDGCSPICTIEDGWVCPRPGRPCVAIPVCGNGRLERGETCDDGNTESEDGCSGTEDDDAAPCQLEAGFWCPGAGLDCAPIACGDGLRSPDEECDDGDDDDDDGCSAACSVEDGWLCTTPGTDCIPICGDGIRRGAEECDDGNRDSTDGCNAACRLEPGFVCPDDGLDCVPAVCGNDIEEPGEGCDDGNRIAGDGCSPSCQREPTVTVGPSPVVNVFCGDGMVTGDEECDDGNDDDGDGCSASCTIEDGFACETNLVRPEFVEFAVTYRDFKRDSDEGGHPDFEWVSDPFRLGIPGPVCTTSNTEPCLAAPGAVCPADSCGVLDAEGKPVFHLTGTASARGRVTSADTYALWYRDTNADDIEGAEGVIDMCHVADSLRLDQLGGDDSDVYQFSSTSHFPLGTRCFGLTPGETRNYHFTTELRYFFQYQGGETLTFRGDDDVWVFVNGRHAVDIGGVHAARDGRVVLGDDGSGGSTDSDCSRHGDDLGGDCTLEAGELASDTDARFGLVRGGVYEIVLFHAERHTSASNFRLTLQGFLAPRSYCTPICGDGVITGWEVCDDGLAGNTGDYGQCDATCTARTFCGDAIRQGPDDVPPGPEACDDGYNNALYTYSADSCAAECKLPPSCGDGNVDVAFELCDDGELNDDLAYDGCTTRCTWGPYCGDGTLQEDEGEQCDKGRDNVPYSPSGSACGPDCTPAPYCGDGIRNGPEQCDEGTDGNTGEYGGCKEDCTLAPYCGDRITQTKQGEQCDDGPAGSLLCTPTCTLRDQIR